MAHLDLTPDDTAGELRHRLAQLPAAQLRALIECFYRGQDVHRASARLGVPVAVLKQQLRMAARSLNQRPPGNRRDPAGRGPR